jgi:hypothetical protein
VTSFRTDRETQIALAIAARTRWPHQIPHWGNNLHSIWLCSRVAGAPYGTERQCTETAIKSAFVHRASYTTWVCDSTGTTARSRGARQTPSYA